MVDGVAVATFWAMAGRFGGAAVGWYYHSREQRLGISRSGLPYIATAALLLVGAFALPALTSGRLQEVASAVAAAYLVFTGLERSSALAVLNVVVAVVPALAAFTAATTLFLPSPFGTRPYLKERDKRHQGGDHRMLGGY